MAEPVRSRTGRQAVAVLQLVEDRTRFGPDVEVAAEDQRGGSREGRGALGGGQQLELGGGWRGADMKVRDAEAGFHAGQRHDPGFGPAGENHAVTVRDRPRPGTDEGGVRSALPGAD